MSNAASQASDLYESTVKNEAVFTFQDDDGYLVFHIRGIEAVPFWSCCERCERVQTQHPKYLNWSIVTESLQEFMNETLALFETEKIHFGMNWSRKQLTGYDVPVTDMRKNFESLLNKQ
jgi:hypothetical protein